MNETAFDGITFHKQREDETMLQWARRTGLMKPLQADKDYHVFFSLNQPDMKDIEKAVKIKIKNEMKTNAETIQT